MAAQLFKQRRRPLWAGQACCSTVCCHHVAPITQLSVVLLPTLLAVKKLSTGWVSLLQLALQMVLLVEHGLKEGRVLALLSYRDTGQVPEQTQARLMRILQRADHQSTRPLIVLSTKMNGKCC